MICKNCNGEGKCVTRNATGDSVKSCDNCNGRGIVVNYTPDTCPKKEVHHLYKSKSSCFRCAYV